MSTTRDSVRERAVGFSAGVFQLAATLLLFAACSDATPSVATTRVATLELRTQIGANGEYIFITISQLIATPRFLYVGQRGEPSIMVFGIDGSYVKTIGRAVAGRGQHPTARA